MTAKGARTRERIIRQSLQLFSIKGYFHTGISDILAASGLTKGGLYGHFASKEEIWYAVYDEALTIWRTAVMTGLSDTADPLQRIEKAAVRHLEAYLGAEVFAGGCFFVNMMVELSDQSSTMSRHLLKGFVRFARLLTRWLDEARGKALVPAGLNHREIANFILIALNGAATLYIASRDPKVLDSTAAQLRWYIQGLRNAPVLPA